MNCYFCENIRIVMRRIIPIICIFFLASFICGGQAFMSKYNKLTNRNISVFFKDWKAYSDSVADNISNRDTVAAAIINQDMALSFALKGKGDEEGVMPLYKVVPQYIEVDRYYIEADTTYSNFGFAYSHHRKDTIFEYSIDSITPQLPKNGLYLTPRIDRVLSKFVGGLAKGKGEDKFGKINRKNVSQLQHYIPVCYGHWGGYWWFYSFPVIYNVKYADNVIVLKRRTSWCTGDELWYPRKEGGFVRDSHPKCGWIE